MQNAVANIVSLLGGQNAVFMEIIYDGEWQLFHYDES